MILVLMGVTASGKTTVGKLLAAETGWQFAEGDDFHSEANRKKMHAGIPLTDEDRAPWLDSIHRLLLQWSCNGTNGILACSALKQEYRDVLSAEIPSTDIRFVMLEVPRAVLEERLRRRTGHYMNPGLLQSQLDTLEMPSDAILVSADRNPQRIAENILAQLSLKPGKPQA